MCGLLAFTGEIETAEIQALVDQSRRRGPDSLGIAWKFNGSWEIRKYRTPSWPDSFRVIRPTQAHAGIGHARLATSGTMRIEDAQPLLIEGMAFAHNGTVYDHNKLARKWALATDTGNDSEVLGRLFRLFGYDAESAIEELRKHQGITPHAWIAAEGQRIWLASYGQPLYYRMGERSKVACSWRFRDCLELEIGSMLVWRV